MAVGPGARAGKLEIGLETNWTGGTPTSLSTLKSLSTRIQELLTQTLFHEGDYVPVLYNTDRDK